jgi:hypothetical protein
MSLKRPLSPESNNQFFNNDTQQLKRLKLHSIIQELRNEEAKLVLLKKLRMSQQLLTRTNKNLTPPTPVVAAAAVTNGIHPAATRIVPPTTKPVQLPITNSIVQQQPIPTATRKSSNSPLLTNSNKISSIHTLEERKSQSKLTLRKQLERDLLNIPLPKPSLQDILFIPNGTSLEFQPYLGLEDVTQCLTELYNDRHRLPQRFTDRAHIDEPHICHQCGTDFTIRWWKNLNLKSSNLIINILCDRCKKQVTRRTSKSEHSTLLKNVFISAMEQEKEIEKHFNVLIKQQKDSSRSSSKSVTTNSRQIPSTTITPTFIPSTNHQHQIKNHVPQNFATKLSQQSVRKSNVTHGNHSRTVQQQHQKISMPIHHSQQYRSINNLPQPIKNNQMVKIQKNLMKQEHMMPSSRSIFPPNIDLINSFLASNLVRPTATKRRTFPTVELK